MTFYNDIDLTPALLDPSACSAQPLEETSVALVGTDMLCMREREKTVTVTEK